MSKITSKTLNCGKTRHDWAKRLVIQVSVTPNRVESGEISQTAKLLFPSVMHRINYSRPIIKSWWLNQSSFFVICACLEVTNVWIDIFYENLKKKIREKRFWLKLFIWVKLIFFNQNLWSSNLDPLTPCPGFLTPPNFGVFLRIR